MLGRMRVRRWAEGEAEGYGWAGWLVARCQSCGFNGTTYTHQYTPADKHCNQDLEGWFHLNTPLHQAMWLGNFEVAQFLLDAGAKVYNAPGAPALHEALWYADHEEAICFLIEHGAGMETTTIKVHDRIEHTRLWRPLASSRGPSQ